jgi:hypothetical protein
MLLDGSLGRRVLCLVGCQLLASGSRRSRLQLPEPAVERFLLGAEPVKLLAQEADLELHRLQIGACQGLRAGLGRRCSKLRLWLADFRARVRLLRRREGNPEQPGSQSQAERAHAHETLEGVHLSLLVWGG